ncbi:MAG: hypothetical protein ACK523_10020 [Pirellulaceae bacterium]
MVPWADCPEVVMVAVAIRDAKIALAAHSDARVMAAVPMGVPARSMLAIRTGR